MDAPQFGAFLDSDPIVLAGVAVLGVALGYIISDRTRREWLGFWHLLLGLLVLAVVVAAVALILDNVEAEPAAMIAAALTLVAALVALYLAGGAQRIATEPFAIEDAHAAETTLAKDSVVPPGVEHLPPLEGKWQPRPLATETIVWWEGGEERRVRAGELLDESQTAQAPAVDYLTVASERVTFRDPTFDRKHLEAGAPVSDDLAELPEFEGRTITKDGARTAAERIEYRDPAHVGHREADQEVAPALLTLPEFAGKTKRVARATLDFTYYDGATRRTIAAGAPVPDDPHAARAASGRTRPGNVTTAEVKYRARLFVRGDAVPTGVGDDVPTRPVGVRRGVYLRRLVVGEDGRWSTSKLQVVLWTLAVLFILIALLYFTEILGDPLDGHAGTDGDKPKDGVDFSELEIPAAYYILLGGPFAAAILAKALTATKTENGTLAKPQSTEPAGPLQGLNEVVSDDAGRVDVVDLQYFAFNLIALCYVIGAFVTALTSGFPEVPEAIFGLTGAAALAYTTKKATDRLIPTITNVSPRRVRPGDVLDIWGQNLVLGTGAVPRVELDGRPVADAEVVKSKGGALPAGRRAEDHVRVKVPPLSGDDAVELVVVPEGGRPTDPEQLQVDRGSIESVDPEPLRIGRDDRLLIRGRGLAEDQATTSVLLGGTGLDLEGTVKPDLVVATLRPGQTYATGTGVRLVVEAGERSATRLIAVEQPRITDVAPDTLPRSATDDITISGTALVTRERPVVKLGDQELQVISQEETRIVARMRAGGLARYPKGSADVTLELGGKQLAKHSVTVADT